MKFYKENTNIEKTLQAIENMMRENGLTIRVGYNGGLFLTHGQDEGRLARIDTGESVVDLPRELDDERIEVL